MRIGLIINELVTNSIKHIDESTVDVKIAVYQDRGGSLKLKYEDNGEGILKHLQSADVSKSMGLQLIQLLRSQLKGTVEVLLM